MWQAAPALRHIKSRKRQRLSKAISHNTHHIPAPATPSLRATLYPTPTPDRPLSLKMAFVSVFTGLAVAARTPVAVCRTRMALEGGKSSGGGEATRDPEPTAVDPNDPKGKQQAIHVAPSFADYLKAQAEKKAAEGK
eukprot:TRINITY_DN332_c0_g1_i7.p2 TRINITY_DN332_c0_g1~~TRINITY_DN332_c0_g1_i7.p2  ORF type:complete len:137 (+),score=20.99 TRINITY_DN332_c0_g1_i7:135-545(+)